MVLLILNMILTTPMEEREVSMVQTTPLEQEGAVNLMLMIQTTEKAASMDLVARDLDMEMMNMILTTQVEEREVSMIQMTPQEQEGAVNLTQMIQITEEAAIFLDLVAEKEASMVLVDLDQDMEMMNMILTTLMEERGVSMVPMTQVIQIIERVASTDLDLGDQEKAMI